MYKEGDIIRELYTLNYYLVVKTIPSERTGQTVAIKTKSVGDGEDRHITWEKFTYFEVAA
jgi:hypothetical protein